MTEHVLAFGGLALVSVWAKGKGDTVATTLAVLVAAAGLQAYGWVGWQWDWVQAGWYGILLAGMAVGLWAVYRDEAPSRIQGKPLLDYAALVLWGIVQQAVLLGFLAQVNPWLAVAVFTVVHWPNRLLTAVVLVGGSASILIMHGSGLPAILPAGLAHAGLSWWIRDVLGRDMGVGRSHDD